MTTSHRSTDYPLGNTDAEHERLIRQAARVAPITERFFREAGIGLGQRVLDLGSGVGDVAMLVARLVGPSGEVVAIERDSNAVAKARARVTEAGFNNVSFNESNVDEILYGKPFDAAVGRFILMYLPDPVATLRSISQAVRPGGVFVFQEPCWIPVLAHLASLPLWFATASLIDKAMRASANHDMGTELYQTFVKAGLPEPVMRMELPVERSPTWHNGITIPCAVCDRRWSGCICPSSPWVALTPWCTGCKPRLQNQKLLRAGLHLSGRGAAKLSRTKCLLFDVGCLI